MDYQRLAQKRDLLRAKAGNIDPAVRDKYDAQFAVTYTHESTAMEGNTLTLRDTLLLLEYEESVGGKKLRELYEVVNHAEAFRYIKEELANGYELSASIVKTIHEKLMNNILQGGIYRNVDVAITGAAHSPLTPNRMFDQLKNFYDDLAWKYPDNDILRAVWTHAEFVKIHPFVDGNGRTSRLLMNYQLMKAGFLPVSIPTEQRQTYFSALEEYAVNNKLEPFADMVATLEEEQLDYYIRAIQE